MEFTAVFTKRRIKYLLIIGVFVWLLFFVSVFKSRSYKTKYVDKRTIGVSSASIERQVRAPREKDISNITDNQRLLDNPAASRGSSEQQISAKRENDTESITNSKRVLENPAASIGDTPSIKHGQSSSDQGQHTTNKQSLEDRNKTIVTSPVPDRITAHSHQHSSYGHCESGDFQHVNNINITSAVFFTSDFKLTEEPMRTWLAQETKLCDDSIKIYGNSFGVLRDAVINPKAIVNFVGVAKGGESISDVKAQSIKKEDYKFNHGIFEMACSDSFALAKIQNSNYDRLRQLKLVPTIGSTKDAFNKTVEKYTIAIVREDYANLWNHMFELYGVFMLMMVFNKQPEDINVLFLDGHPSCMLDRNWEHIFGPVQRVGRLDGPVLYKNLIWGLAENRTPLSKWENPTCPYVEEFRTFVLNQYDIVENAKKLDCKRLTFTFIVRRNQVYHPRNLEGNVERKIFNELEVIETLMDRFPGVCIQALLMESIPMRAQLEIISETDVLIGMHGAGMMHATFLPPHAGVLELFPREWRKTRKHSVMYEVLADKWRKLKYAYWQNPDQKREFTDRVTIVDTDKVYFEIKRIFNKLCS